MLKTFEETNHMYVKYFPLLYILNNVLKKLTKIIFSWYFRWTLLAPPNKSVLKILADWPGTKHVSHRKLP